MDEKCIKCTRKRSIFIKHLGSFCSACFVKVLEKRIRKYLSKNKIFSTHDKILFINDNSLKAEAGIFFLNSIQKDIPLKIKIKSVKPEKITSKIAKKYDKIVIPWNLDNEIILFLESIFKAEKMKKQSFVKLLKPISDEELEMLAKVRNFKKPMKKTGLSKVLDHLEKKYPGSKFGLLKTAEELTGL